MATASALRFETNAVALALDNAGRTLAGIVLIHRGRLQQQLPAKRRLLGFPSEVRNMLDLKSDQQERSRERNETKTLSAESNL